MNRPKGYFDPSKGFCLPAGYHKLVDDGGGGGGGATAWPALANYRFECLETQGSSLADLSEIWLGTDATTRFTGTPTETQADGTTPDSLVNGTLSDSQSQSATADDGAWWGLEYPLAQLLTHIKAARPGTTSSRRPKSWALRAYDPDLDQWLTAVVRIGEDDFISVSAYSMTFEAAGGVLVTPVARVGSTGMWSEYGYTFIESYTTSGSALTIPGHTSLRPNDAVLLIWGNMAGSTPAALSTALPWSPAVDEAGLLAGVRTVGESAEPSYDATNDDGAGTSMAGISLVLHNVSAGSPIGEAAVATATKAPAGIDVTPSQAVLVVALYDTNLLTTDVESGTPAGMVYSGSEGRSAGAGSLTVAAWFRAAEDEGAYTPNAITTTDTPAKVATIAVNAAQP